uniref:Uncharacterized protein n=1 Tax=Ceratitis capitata TaxID=7213 RepID=W8BY29_CERCA
MCSNHNPQKSCNFTPKNLLQLINMHVRMYECMFTDIIYQVLIATFINLLPLPLLLTIHSTLFYECHVQYLDTPQNRAAPPHCNLYSCNQLQCDKCHCRQAVSLCASV